MKPDISLATKSGHFYLLTTSSRGIGPRYAQNAVIERTNFENWLGHLNPSCDHEVCWRCFS